MKSPQRRTYGPCCPPHTAAWALLATIHAVNREELARKPLFARLLEMRYSKG